MASEANEPSVVGVPEEPGFDLFEWRESEEGKKLAAWAQSEFSRCRSSKTVKQRQWYINMSFVFGQQWIDIVNHGGSGGSDFPLLKAKAAPRHIQRRTINRIRSFVRTEQSKFLSTLPSVEAVPATSEEEDIRAAYAGEQVWQSYLSRRLLRREYSRAVWWMIVTGNGFIKTWWDPALVFDEQPGDIAFRSVPPFHIFAPDLREREIDDQPYMIHAYVKPLVWAKQFWAEELDGVDISPSQTTSNALLDDSLFKVTQTPRSELDAVLIQEMWVKPGTHKSLPNGGLLILVEDTIVSAHIEGMPYRHGQYPFTKVEHMMNDTFFADSPLVDLVELQKEFNESRTQIGLAARRMGNPQLLAQQGSVSPAKITNEAGLVIQYRPGTPPPSPLPLQPLPEYVLNIPNQVLQDFEDLSGQHEVSKGQTPTGVTAGTALAFLKETDDAYLTPQYQNVEDAFERIARQTLNLFQEFVDVPRKLKVIGSDGAFDTALLSGADIKDATDIRVEPGSAVGQSQAAKRAAVMDMFSVGILQDPNQALRLLEMGGAQKILDTVSVAEKKAQRENTRIKTLKSEEGQMQIQQFAQERMLQMLGPMVQQLYPEVAEMGEEGVMMAIQQIAQEQPELMQQVQQQIPPMVPADDFDMHEVHIEMHNRYRMGQEYETLPDPVKEQFDKHVEMHQMLLQQQMMQRMMMGGGMPPEEEQGPQGPEEQEGQPPMPPQPGEPPM